MLEVEISQFLCYYTLQKFSFNQGLNLLQGSSGSGKSSILRAINFALFGDRNSNVISFGESKCSVTVKFDGYIITRKKGPGKLALWHDGVEYTGDSAQEIINAWCGKYFQITSYITQQKTDSFFHLSPSDRLIFLEDLVIGDAGIVTLKKACMEKIRAYKRQLTETVGELKIVERELGKVQKPSIVEFPLSGKYSEEKIGKFQENHAKVKKLVARNREKLPRLKARQYEQELARQRRRDITAQQAVAERELAVVSGEIGILYTGNADLIQRRIDYLNTIAELNNMKVAYKKDLQQYKALCIVDKDQLQQQCDELVAIGKVESRLVELKKLIQIKINTELAAVLKEELEDYDSKENYENAIRDLDEEQNKLMQQKTLLRERSVIRKCPQCKTPVKLNNNSELVIAAMDIEPIVQSQSEIETKLIDVKKQRESWKSMLHDLLDLQKRLKGVGKTDASLLTRNLEKELAEHEKELYEQVEREKTIERLKRKITTEEYSHTIQSLKRKLDVSNEGITKLEAELSKGEVYVDVPEKDNIDDLRKLLLEYKVVKEKCNMLKKQKQSLESKLDALKRDFDTIVIDEEDLQGQIEVVETTIEQYGAKEEEYDEKAIRLRAFTQYRTELQMFEKWKSDHDRLQDVEDRTKKDLLVGELLMRKIKETESIALVNIIENINSHMRYYLEKFFADPIDVEIVSFEETKSGEKKPCIGIRVGYKGCESSIEALSGGEVARVELAICLSINNVIGGKLLLLDEVLAALNPESISGIIDVLRAEAHEQGKLIICIAHQAIEGDYDHAVSLE